MRTFRISSFVALVALFFAVNAFAASDYLLELDGIKGECKGKHIKLTEQADGSFTAENIPPGTYQLTYKAKAGKTGSTKRGDGSVTLAFEGVVSPRDVATGQSSGKRDAASGQATGKRQHKPFVITKELDKSSPQFMLGEILIGDLDGDGVLDAAPEGTAKTSAPVKAGYDLKLAKKV
jgi:hypothetical protein